MPIGAPLERNGTALRVVGVWRIGILSAYVQECQVEDEWKYLRGENDVIQQYWNLLRSIDPGTEP